MFQYLLLIFEYLYIKRIKLLFSLIPSIIIGFSICFGNLRLTIDEISFYTSNSINVLGILLGFTASIFAIIITTNDSSINKAKTKETSIKLYKKPFTVYDQLVVSCAFLILLLGFLLLLNFLLPIYKNILANSYLELFSINISLIIFAIIQLVLSILNFYFIITNQNDKSDFNS